MILKLDLKLIRGTWKKIKSDDELSISYDLELFGSEFFQTFQTSFMPINEPNPDSSYTLDNGDVLNIQLIGQIDFIDIFPVNRDGTINIPDVENFCSRTYSEWSLFFN